MKKFSKILAVILTVTLLGGMIAVLSSAAPATVDSENQLVIPPNGSGLELVSGNFDYNDYEAAGATRDWVGAHGFPDFTYSGNEAIKTDANGNKYLTLRRNNAKTGNNNGTNGYLEWKLSGWNNNASNYANNNMVGKYDFNVFDLDFKTDAYSVWVGYRLVRYTPSGKDAYWSIEKAYRTYDEVDSKTVAKDIDAVYNQLLADVEKNKAALTNIDYAVYTGSKISLDEALATKTLALMPGGNFYVGLRGYTTTEYTSSAKGVYGFLYTSNIDGTWYLSTKSGSGPVVEIKHNEYIHITYITAASADGSSFTIHLFVNGEYVLSSSGLGGPIVCADSFRIQAPVDYKDEDIYSYCFDNVTSNYYEKGYNSGEVYGLDDYFDEGDYKTKPVYELSDVVFNSDYSSPNGYITVDGVKASLTYDNMYANLANVVDGSVVETTVDILDYSIPAGVNEFTVCAPYGNAFTLSNDYVNDYFVIFNGIDTYTIRRASDDEKMTLNWVYIDPVSGEQSILKTEKILSGSVPNQDDPSFVSTHFDFDSAALITNGYINWKFDIDNDSGDVDLYEMEDVRALTYYESLLVMEEMGGILNIYTNEIGVKNTVYFNYFVGSYDAEGNFVLKADETGTYENYTNVKKLDAEMARVDDGDVVIFKEGSVIDLGADYFVNVPEGKNVSVDLNGSVIARSAAPTTNYVDGLFRVNEGTTFNLYSSKPGAHYAEAVITKLDSNRVFGTGGVVSVATAVDGCTINVDAENISFTGGTLFKFVGSWSSTAAIPAPNNVKKVLNIKGGSYYSAFRSSYAAICVQCPDVEINIEDAEFYVNDATYAIIHDYADDSSNSKYYSSTHTLTAKNCEFVCVSPSGSYGKLYYTMGKNSSAYFEDCSIIGLLAKSSGDLKGSVTLGDGNKISTSKDFLTHSKISAADGVSIANTGDKAGNLDLSVKHSTIPNRTLIVVQDENSAYVYDATTNAFNIVGGKYQLNLDKLVESSLTVSRFDTFAIAMVSFAEGTVPPGSVPINWYDSDGSILATTYGYPGATTALYPIEKVASKDTDSKWYNVGYSAWINVSDGAEADSLEIIDGENEFVPGGTALVADIEALTNMTYWSHFGVNLFIPMEDGITFVYKSGAKDTGFFDASAPTVKLSTNVYKDTPIYYNGERILTYYVRYLPTVQDYASDEKIVKFIVNEYDINGDGVIGEGETNIPLEQSFALNDMEYAIKAAGILECGSDEMNLIASFVRYKKGAYSEIVKGELSAEAQAYFDRFDAALAAHGENCSCYSDYTKVDTLFTDAEKAINSDSYSQFVYNEENGTGVVAVSYTMNLDKPSFSIYVAKKSGVTYTPTLKYTSLTTGKSVTHSTKVTEDFVLNGIECTRYEYRSIPAEQINAIFNITVKAKVSGVTTTYTGQYCLAEYIDNNPEYDMAKIYYDYSYQCLSYYNKMQAIQEALGQGEFDDELYGVVIRYDGTK